jgi:DNA-binding transcriptional LysR family regulator
VDLHCDNRLLDLVGAGFDAGIRLGESLAQDMVAVPLGGPRRMVTFAAPSYLARHGAPQMPEDLHRHQCLNIRMMAGGLYRWEYAHPDGRVFDIQVFGRVESNDNAALTVAARCGAGIGCAFEDEVREDFARGTLAPLLEPWWPSFDGFYLYYPSRVRMPRKLRAFIDFLQPRFRKLPNQQ